MFYNYLKIALRNLAKHRFISFINLFGLTVGLACCLVIVTYILNELSYDRFNEKADRIYRVTRSFNTPDGVVNLRLSAVAPPFAPLLQNEFPDIQKTTRLLQGGITSLKFDDKLFNEQNVFFADENLFDFFPVPVVKGSASTALAEPNSIMLTEKVARKYFGDADPVNKLIRVNNLNTFKVTGIFKEFPANTHLHPEVLLSFNTLKDSVVYGEKQLSSNWGNNAFYTYLMFPPHYPVASIEKQFPAFLDKYVYFPGQPATIKQSRFTQIYLQKLTDIHLYSHLDDEAEPNGSISRVYIFSAIALFILLIACINYMNLSTARSALRAREIGIRKVAGAQRKTIIAQFLSESMLITWFAMLLAFVLTWLVLPYINKLSGQSLSISRLLSPAVLIPVAILPFVVGTLSGLYPALFMSSFKPALVLKGLFSAGKGSISFRKVLVVAQFSISIILIIATTVVFRQLYYIQTASLGYDKDHIVTIPYQNSLNSQFESFRSEMLQYPGIAELGRSSRVPTGRLLDNMAVQVLSGDSMVNPANVNLTFVAVDHNFIPAYDIKMAAGRNFSRDFLTDSTNYVINRSAVEVLGWKTAENAIGKDLSYGGVKGKVIGVMNDFHFESMHQKIVPLLLMMPGSSLNFYGSLSVRIKAGNIPSTLAGIERIWKKYLPETPFQSAFLNETYNRLYQSEQQQSSIFSIFAAIAIFIACLGLFGLSAFAITQRIKEIGIRKVLGASTGSIVTLLSKDFLKLVAVAAVIAFPVAWYAMNQWLQDFAYRINMPWWIFILAGILAACVALFTIGFQAIKAAVSNPVKNLRTE